MMYGATMPDSRVNQPPASGAPPSDRSLLRRLKQGEEDAATDLYLRYARRLETLAQVQASPALAARFDPDDVVQSVFRTFFRRASEGQYDIPPGEELWGLFLVIALNKIRKLGAYHRAAKRDVAATAGAEQIDQSLHHSRAGDETAAHMLRMVIEDVLEQLPPIQRKMVELRIEGHDVAAIAARTERSKRTVERVLQRFRQRLGALVAE